MKKIDVNSIYKVIDVYAYLDVLGRGSGSQTSYILLSENEAR